MNAEIKERVADAIYENAEIPSSVMEVIDCNKIAEAAINEIKKIAEEQEGDPDSDYNAVSGYGLEWLKQINKEG